MHWLHSQQSSAISAIEQERESHGIDAFFYLVLRPAVVLNSGVCLHLYILRFSLLLLNQRGAAHTDDAMNIYAHLHFNLWTVSIRLGHNILDRKVAYDDRKRTEINIYKYCVMQISAVAIYDAIKSNLPIILAKQNNHEITKIKHAQLFNKYFANY